MSGDGGGQAFPRAGFGFAYRDEGAEQESSTDGMTLRDYFAAKAMQALLVGEFESNDTLAHSAYAVADAMLHERSK